MSLEDSGRPIVRVPGAVMTATLACMNIADAGQNPFAMKHCPWLHDAGRRQMQ
jgi:hypothetical protein